MSLPKYAEYKDSGVAWLGKVPAHWLITPVKRFGRLKGGAGFPHAEQGHESEDLPFHKVNALGRAGSDGVLRGSENNISQATAERLGAHVFPPKSLVFAKVGAALLLGRIRVLAEAACIDNNMMGLVVDSEIADFAFVRYALNLVRFDLIANPGAVPSLNEGQIGNFPLVLPSWVEQSAIAAFLDRETGKIDALIIEQEKLLTLLAEKRQATISHAVTRGLNPNAPMKDSGVPWLGEVPAHWDVKSLKYVIADSKAGPFGSAITKDMYVSEGYRVYGQEQVIPADFSKGDYFIDEHKYLELQQYRVATGDVLISCVGTFGKIAIVPEGVHPGVINPRLIRLRVADDVSADFLVTVLRSAVVFEQFSLLSRGGTMDVINIGTLSGIELAVPPHEEQLAIVHFTVHAAAKLDALKDEAEHVIALLKERRSALIAAAVTGKVDVRHAA